MFKRYISYLSPAITEDKSDLSSKSNNKRFSVKENHKGFTIVEVMIVLAIAGLILAVVFVAVPALQRNQRNNARITDISLLRAEIDTTIANRGGKLPFHDGANVTAISDVLFANTELSYYELSDVGYHNVGGSATATQLADANARLAVNEDKVLFIGNAKCDTAAAHATTNTGYVKDNILYGGVSATNLGDKSKVSNLSVILAGGANGVAHVISGGNRNVAVLYVLEGSTDVYCIDDVN